MPVLGDSIACPVIPTEFGQTFVNEDCTARHGYLGWAYGQHGTGNEQRFTGPRFCLKPDVAVNDRICLVVGLDRYPRQRQVLLSALQPALASKDAIGAAIRAELNRERSQLPS